MATPWTFAQRLAAYRAEGITKIVIMPGAATHNRDTATGKTFGPVHGAVIHHTAGDWDHDIDGARYCYRGSSDLPGPVCHDFLGEDGTLYVIGHGRTNHAGTTTPAVRDAMIAEQPPAGRRFVGKETVDANDFTFGLEIENRGDGKDPYEPAQYDVAVRWGAAVCRWHGWEAESLWGHKEITTRKPDPSFSMGIYRGGVAERLRKTPAPPTNGTPPVNAFTSLARGEDTVIDADETKVIYWTAEYQDGPGDHGTGGKTVISGEHATGVVALQFGAPVPAGVSVFAVHELDDGTRSYDYGQQLVAGLVRHAFPYTGRVTEAANLVFEIRNDATEAVTLIHAVARFGSWDL